MLSVSCCAQPVLAARPAAGPRSRRSPAPPQRLNVARQLCVRPCAFKSDKGHQNGSGAKQTASPEAMHATKMINLVQEYFNELMTNGNTDLAPKILDASVEHRDMVRNEGRYGLQDIQQYLKELKKTYPDIYVKPTQFAVADDHSLFVAFEGRATSHTPLFKGVDLFCFTAGADKIARVEVYRSNWLGAQGHEERKRVAAQQQHGGS